MIENVGKSNSRNKEFFKKFDKARIIKQNIKKENPVCFDVGAYQGQSVQYLKNLFDKPLIYSFEPSLKNYQIIKNKKYKDNICFNMAISNFTGETVFYENKIAHTSSLFKVNIDSKDSVEINKGNANDNEKLKSTYNKEVKIKTTTLDDFYRTQKLTKIDLLKIDVQGAEVLVIEGGMESFLKNTQAIMIEVSLYDYYERNNGIYDIEKNIFPLGFKLYSIIDISQNPMNGRTDWVELLYLRED